MSMLTWMKRVAKGNSKGTGWLPIPREMEERVKELEEECAELEKELEALG